jgi:vacuolar protein sorting-associated protein 51
MGKSASTDPMNLGEIYIFLFTSVSPYLSTDSTAFDAKSYYEQLITTSSLPSLLKRENELLTGSFATH